MRRVIRLTAAGQWPLEGQSMTAPLNDRDRLKRQTRHLLL
jgi:hypothetical protein